MPMGIGGCLFFARCVRGRFYNYVGMARRRRRWSLISNGFLLAQKLLSNSRMTNTSKNTKATSGLVRSAGLILGAGLLCGVCASPALAEQHSATDKLGRGAAGVMTGVLELPGNMMAAYDSEGASGLPIGFAKGVGMVLVREVVGAYEIVTAPFPVPAGYKPAIQPEYPWDYFGNARDARAARNTAFTKR